MHVGWSNFALQRNQDPLTSASFTGRQEELIQFIIANWDQRQPGAGRRDLTQVVIVPLPACHLGHFKCRLTRIELASNFQVTVTRRQPQEDPYLVVTAEGPPLPCTSAAVVLYSAQTLLENDGERSGNYDWEIVAILAGPWKDEPMQPLTMARNFLGKPGGTFAPYSAEDLAQSIYHWSGYVQTRN